MHSTRRKVVLMLATWMLLGAASRIVLAQATTRAVDIDQLVADLSSEDWKLRQTAADALAELDVAAIPRLKRAAELAGDVDERTALLAAVRRIEEADAIGPTRIWLNVTDAPAVEVFHAVGRQIAFPMAADGAEQFGDARVTLTASGEPFWSVMRQIAAQTPLRLGPLGNDSSRVLLATTGNNFLNPRAAVAGPFLICPMSVSSSQQIDLQQDKPQAKFRSLTLQAAVMAEPKLRVSRLSVTPKTAVDETGKSILTATPAAAMAMSVSTQQTMIPIRLQGGSSNSIAKLTGSIRARLPSRTRRVEQALTELDKDLTVDLNGRATKVVVRQRDSQFDVKIQLPLNAGPMDEAAMSAYRDVSLVDEQGRPLLRRQMTQAQVPQGNRPAWEYTVTFARDGLIFGQENVKVGEPAKLIWDLAVEYRDLDVPFELTNIPLVSQ